MTCWRLSSELSVLEIPSWFGRLTEDVVVGLTLVVVEEAVALQV